MKNKQKNSEIIKDGIKILTEGFCSQIILYGPPGTSKTYSAQKIAKSITENNPGISKDNDKDIAIPYIQIIQFHPSYNYDDFIRGITVKTIEKQIVYETQDKIFGKTAKAAAKDNKNKYVLIIDEINRAPLASVLGELIYGLEYRKKSIFTPYEVDGTNELKIPENLYIIGTMNTADRSIGTIDYAVRRRFAFLPVYPEREEIAGTWDGDEEPSKTGDNGLGNENGGTTENQNTESKILEILQEADKNDTNKIINIDKDKSTGQLTVSGKLASIGQLAVALFDYLIGNSDERDKSKENGMFSSNCLEDQSINADDIKIGHTYFMGRKKTDTGNSDNKIADQLKFLRFRLKYQIMPVYQEYINDGLINRSEGDKWLKRIVDICTDISKGIEKFSGKYNEKA